MAYQPYIRQPIARARVAGIAPPPAPPRGVRRVGLGGFGSSTGAALAQTAVAEVPVVGPILAPFVGSIVNIFDPGKKRDAGRKQRLDGLVQLANSGSLLAARQIYSGAEKGAVGAASEKALYAAAWAAFQSTHADIAAAARAAGAAGVGPDPVDGWHPPASDVAQYQSEIGAYRQTGIAATAAQAVTARASGLPGGTTGLLIGGGLLLAFLSRRR